MKCESDLFELKNLEWSIQQVIFFVGSVAGNAAEDQCVYSVDEYPLRQ